MAWNKDVNYRKRGDAHRSAAEWDQAAEAYAQHLVMKPDDTAIWVQYGHALKESGRVEDAESAYRKATEMRPGDADAHLQLGHALKIQERYINALAEYKIAFDLDSNAAVEHEIRNLKWKIKHAPTAVLPEGTTLYSLQDMFQYLKVHSTMTGIQRVQAGIAAHLINTEEPATEFILTDGSGGLEAGDFWQLRKEDIAAIIDYASGEQVEHSTLIRLIEKGEQNASAIRAGKGHTIIILGAFWGLGNTLDRFLPAKWAGAKLGAYVYDIIPISHPEYCTSELSRYFGTAFAEMCLVVDFIFTISDYTKEVVQKYLANNGGREIPMTTVPLAHSLTGAVSGSQSWPKALQRLKGRDYVAYVSTIEGRKNHAYVVNIWQKLISEGVEVPDLVFVGRKGWRVSGLFEHLEATHFLGGRVHIVHDLSDGELNAVYENAQFTVFTSFVEGWGLPIGESLLHGTPCVASDVSSIPEVGGDFVDYLDPYNTVDGARVIGRMITDKAYLAERRQNIADNFQARTWDDVADMFVAQARLASALPTAKPTHPVLKEGLLFKPSDLIDSRIVLNDYVRSPVGMLIAESFYNPEGFGAWMKGKYGEITFKTDLAPGTPVIVYLTAEHAPWAGDCTISVALDGKRTNARKLPLSALSAKSPISVRGIVDENNTCRVTFQIDGDFAMPENDPRSFVMGLSGLGMASATNLVARADLFEAFHFQPASGGTDPAA